MMKSKSFLKFMCVLSILLMSWSISFAAAQPISVLLDGQNLQFDVPPREEGGRVLVPVRTIFEALGLDLQWDGNTQTVTAIREEIQVKLKIGSKKAYVNGQSVTLDVPAKTISGRTFVPVRFLAEAFGIEVKWDEGSREVILTMEEEITWQTYEDEVGYITLQYPDFLGLPRETYTQDIYGVESLGQVIFYEDIENNNVLALQIDRTAFPEEYTEEAWNDIRAEYLVQNFSQVYMYAEDSSEGTLELEGQEYPYVVFEAYDNPEGIFKIMVLFKEDYAYTYFVHVGNWEELPYDLFRIYEDMLETIYINPAVG